MPPPKKTPQDALLHSKLTIAAASLAKRRSAGQSGQAVLEWARGNAQIVDPIRGRMPFEPWPYQEAILLDQSPRRIILKARQVGISNTMALEALHCCMTQEQATCLFVSRNQGTAQQIIQYCQIAIGGLRFPPKLEHESLSALVFPNGSSIIALPASPGTGRGIPATRVYLDEFAFCGYDSQIYTSILPTLSTGGWLTVLSTPNGKANEFFKMWGGIDYPGRLHDEPPGEWSDHLIHWSDCPRYTPDWAEKMKDDLGPKGWAQEYNCDFVESGDQPFTLADLKLCWEGYDDRPEAGLRFITGADIGRRRDYTVIYTWAEHRDRTLHLVERERFQGPFPVIQLRLEDRWRRRAQRPQDRFWVEWNGIGDPVLENLDVPVRWPHDRQYARAPLNWIQPFQTTPRSKVNAIQTLQKLIEQQRIKHNDDHFDREASLYEYDDKNLQQDCVMAAAIGLHEVSTLKTAPFRVAVGSPRALPAPTGANERPFLLPPPGRVL